jgi:hypothetical protein
MGVSCTSADTLEKLDAIGHQVEIFLFTLFQSRNGATPVNPGRPQKSLLSQLPGNGISFLTYEKN